MKLSSDLCGQCGARRDSHNYRHRFVERVPTKDPVGDEQRETDVEEKAVAAFAEGMLYKLRLNRHKTHWSENDTGYLLGRISDELKELTDALFGDEADPVKAIKECYDVANFAMFIADNLRKELDRGKRHDEQIEG